MAKSAHHWDVAVIGGGAAGLFAAGIAGQRGKRVILLEHNRDVGAKIIISGGGRCNFTNMDVRADRFISANPHLPARPWQAIASMTSSIWSNAIALLFMKRPWASYSAKGQVQPS